MKTKNLITTILGLLMMILGATCFFAGFPISFTIAKFIASELVGLILFRAWMSKDKALNIVERFIK